MCLCGVCVSCVCVWRVCVCGVYVWCVCMCGVCVCDVCVVCVCVYVWCVCVRVCGVCGVCVCVFCVCMCGVFVCVCRLEGLRSVWLVCIVYVLCEQHHTVRRVQKFSVGTVLRASL